MGSVEGFKPPECFALWGFRVAMAHARRSPRIFLHLNTHAAHAHGRARGPSVGRALCGLLSCSAPRPYSNASTQADRHSGGSDFSA
jgi:hypothetical protein